MRAGEIPMKKKKRIQDKWLTPCALLLLLIVARPSCSVAQECDVKKHVPLIEHYYSSLQDFYARFEQETTMGSLKRVEKGKGEVYFKKGGKMLWDYQSPSVQKIILDGKNLWVYLPDDHQVMKNNYSSLPSHIVADLFCGTVHIAKQFTVSCSSNGMGDNASTVVLTLIPIVYNPAVTELVLEVERRTHRITSTQLTDEFGNKTVLRFFDIAVNTGVEDSLFTFVPPPGVDVFEPPRQHTGE